MQTVEGVDVATQVQVVQLQTVVESLGEQLPPPLQQQASALDALAVLVARSPETIHVTGANMMSLSTPALDAGCPPRSWRTGRMWRRRSAGWRRRRRHHRRPRPAPARLGAGRRCLDQRRYRPGLGAALNPNHHAVDLQLDAAWPVQRAFFSLALPRWTAYTEPGSPREILRRRRTPSQQRSCVVADRASFGGRKPAKSGVWQPTLH